MMMMTMTKHIHAHTNNAFLSLASQCDSNQEKAPIGHETAKLCRANVVAVAVAVAVAAV